MCKVVDYIDNKIYLQSVHSLKLSVIKLRQGAGAKPIIHHCIVCPYSVILYVLSFLWVEASIINRYMLGPHTSYIALFDHLFHFFLKHICWRDEVVDIYRL